MAIGGIGSAGASDTNTIKMNNDILNYSKDMRQSKFMLLPGGSTTTLLSNLPVLFDGQGRGPLIYYDEYDFNRLQAQALAYPDDTQTQVRAATVDALKRRGNIKTIDYSRYYSSRAKERNIGQYWRMLRDVSDNTLDKAAQQSNQGHLNIRRGTYQSLFRESIGNLEVNNERRTKLKKQTRRYERGVGDAEAFNENVFAQYAAALEVRHSLNESPNSIHIDGVIGHGGNQGVATVLREADVSLDTPAIELDNRGEWLDNVGRPYPEHPAQRHKLIERLSELGREATGIDENDWYLLGSKFAVPTFDEFIGKSRVDLRGEGPSDLADEARQAVGYLEKQRQENTPDSLEYEAEVLAEEGLQAPGPLKRRLERMADLANYSDDIRDLMGGERFSHGSLLVAASVLSDPQYRFTEDDIYREAWKLIVRHRDLDVSEEEVEFYRNRGQTRRGDGKATDWYHSANPVRNEI